MDFTQPDLKSVMDDLQNVVISVEPFRKSWKTSVTGLRENHKTLLKTWKKLLSCNGHIADDDVLVFQGDHQRQLHKYVVELGIPPSQITFVGSGR